MKKHGGELRDGESRLPLIAVAIDKDKGSQNALKWATDNLVTKGQTLILVHVNCKGGPPGKEVDAYNGYRQPTDPQSKEIFLPFRCFCTRKDIICKDVVIDDGDIVKAVIEFVSQSAIEKLVMGAPTRGGFVRRFKSSDKPTMISKGAPDFCSVYVISKGKVSSMRNAVRPAPAVSPLRTQIQSQMSIKPESDNLPLPSQRSSLSSRDDLTPDARRLQEETIRSPFSRGYPGPSIKSFGELSLSGTDISFVSSGRPSIDRMLPPRLSSGSDGFDHSFEMPRTSTSTANEFSSFSQTSTGTSWSSQAMEDVEAEMRKLRLELKQTMDMYSAACKEALAAKQKAMELNRWKVEEEQRLEEARMAEESAMALVERERARCKAAMEAAQAHQRIAEQEAQKRINVEMKALKESEDKEGGMQSIGAHDVRYRKYTIEAIEKATEFFSESRKIGEGGYGPVFRCSLDHTPVAVKVLRPDAAQGRSQFQQEVEVLSCIRHPNMVLLLGACPEYGCLVYEYMANGSLDDRLFRRGNTPVIPWQHRFRIAAEIATGLLFLHQTKPEPLVHRDLKPGNILLDRNYVSKISDVGLARLVPPTVADTVTQYRMTSTAGTFCYIDPEYQQTGMLGVKSDIYSFGVMLLQILTAKPPMGLTHYVSRAIESGKLGEMLDPAVTDWPIEETQQIAEIALKCAELRRKDRPDLATVILPELNRFRDLAEDQMYCCALGSSPLHSHASESRPEIMSDPLLAQSGYSSRNQSSSSLPGRSSNVT